MDVRKLIPGAAVGLTALVIGVNVSVLLTIVQKVSKLGNHVQTEVQQFRVSSDEAWKALVDLRSGGLYRSRRNTLNFPQQPPYGVPFPQNQNYQQQQQQQQQQHSATYTPQVCGGPRGRPGPPGRDGDAGQHGKEGVSGIDMSTNPDKYMSPEGCRYCPAGYPGPTGPPGKPGHNGPKGYKGSNGIIGRAGNNGRAGGYGQPGHKGGPGKHGPTGKPGRSKRGGKGVAGPKGLEGVMGRAGNQGTPGANANGYYSAGPKGALGKRGPSGQSGKPASRGVGGLKGSKGNPGNDAKYCPCPGRSNPPVYTTLAPAYPPSQEPYYQQPRHPAHIPRPPGIEPTFEQARNIAPDTPVYVGWPETGSNPGVAPPTFGPPYPPESSFSVPHFHESHHKLAPAPPAPLIRNTEHFDLTPSQSPGQFGPQPFLHRDVASLGPPPDFHNPPPPPSVSPLRPPAPASPPAPNRNQEFNRDQETNENPPAPANFFPTGGNRITNFIGFGRQSQTPIIERGPDPYASLDGWIIQRDEKDISFPTDNQKPLAKET